MRKQIPILLMVSCFLAFASKAYSQDNARLRVKSMFLNLPGGVEDEIRALGERLQVNGKEKVVLNGHYEDRGRRFPVRVTLQLPTLVRLEGFNPGGPALAFDGVRPEGRRLEEENLLETLATDTPEGMFTSIRKGAAVVLIGRKIIPNVKDYQGPQYDIYSVTGPVHSRIDSIIRLKRYFFDSKTHLLASTKYTDEIRRLEVEVRFSDWQTVGNSAFPGRIERYEDNQRVFSFIFAAVSNGPWQDPALLPILEEPIDAQAPNKEK